MSDPVMLVYADAAKTIPLATATQVKLAIRKLSKSAPRSPAEELKLWSAVSMAASRFGVTVPPELLAKAAGGSAAGSGWADMRSAVLNDDGVGLINAMFGEGSTGHAPMPVAGIEGTTSGEPLTAPEPNDIVIADDIFIKMPDSPIMQAEASSGGSQAAAGLFEGSSQPGFQDLVWTSSMSVGGGFAKAAEDGSMAAARMKFLREQAIGDRRPNVTSASFAEMNQIWTGSASGVLEDPAAVSAAATAGGLSKSQVHCGCGAMSSASLPMCVSCGAPRAGRSVLGKSGGGGGDPGAPVGSQGAPFGTLNPTGAAGGQVGGRQTGLVQDGSGAFVLVGDRLFI